MLNVVTRPTPLSERRRDASAALSPDSARRQPTVAVVPAAGLGTCLRPLTDAIPGDMLPVGRRLTLERIVDERRGAGIVVQRVAPERISRYGVVKPGAGAGTGGIPIVEKPRPEDALGEARHDIGGLDSYFKAFIAFALNDPDEGKGLRRYAAQHLTAQNEKDRGE